MARIALVGPGAVGCVLAAWLESTRRHELTLCARTAFSELSVETPERSLSFTPRVITEPSAAGSADWLLCATKTYDVPGVAAWLAKFGNAPVAILQNGVEHAARFAELLPAERIVPVIVDIPSERSAPGRARQRGHGRLTVADDTRGREFAALFAGSALELVLSGDFVSAAWRKLCLNAPGILSALLLKPAGILHDEPIAELARGIVRECIAVGRAEGAVLENALADSVVDHYRRAPRDSVNSLHADRAAGRPTENDARNDVIVRLAKKHGISTPYNQMAHALLATLE